MSTQTITGPFWQGRNWSSDAGEGSIHDDATATRLGLRGGTVAGNIHMDQFVAVLRQHYGDAFLTRGTLSLYFRNPTTDAERVRAFVEPKDDGRARVWMQRDDGLEVMSGTASLGHDDASELRTRDLRSVASENLRILRKLRAGDVMPSKLVNLSGDKQRQRIAKNWISDPIPEFKSPTATWSGQIATPSSIVDLLWGTPTEYWRRLVGKSVGLYGAIEVELINGPVLLDREYRVDAQIIALTDSPKTEGFWFDSSASDRDGRLIARHRMLLRFMKASADAYRA